MSEDIGQLASNEGGPGRRNSYVLRFWSLGVYVVTAALGCGDSGDDRDSRESEPDATSGVELQAFHQMFTAVDTLVLEQPENVARSFPLLYMDPQGGFLIADPPGNQVRVYSRTGELEDVFEGGSGKADSLREPSSAARLENGDIIAANAMSGRLVPIPIRHEEDVLPLETSLGRLRLLQVLEERKILIAGRDAAYARNLLHIWDLSRGEIVKSFLPPPQHLDSNVVETIGRGAYAASRGDRFAAMHGMSDTLFFFDHAGTQLSSVPIPVEPFLVPEGTLPNIGSMAERREWIDQFTFLIDVFWIADDELILQWASGSGDHSVYGLVGMDTTGRQIWSTAGTPLLRGVRDDEFFFQDPNSAVPNRVVVAIRKPSS